MKKILILCLFLGGCNSVSAVGHAFDVGNALNIDVDTNGYTSKRSGPVQKVCEYRIDALHTAWKPC